MRTKYTRVLMTLGIAFFGFLASPGLTHAQWTKANNGSKNVSNCVLLTDGTVVCQEGETTSTLVRLTPDPFGSYSSGTWSDTNINPLPSGYAPRFFCSAVLADGRVVFTGGEYNDSSTGETNLGAILDPTANSGMGSWTTLNPPDGGVSPWNQIGDSPCVILPNKKLLLGHFSTTQIAQLDPATLTWTDLSPTGKADGNAEEGFTLLPDGTILVVDTSVGFCGSGGECNITAGVGTTGEIYTPSTNAWAATATTGGVTLDGNVPNCCVPETGPQILRPDGTVIAIGATPNTASYNYLTGVWTAGPSFPTTVSSYPTSTNCPATTATNYPSAGEADGPGSILPDGHVLVAASPVDSSGNEFHCASFFEYDGTNLNPVAGTANAPNVPTFVFVCLWCQPARFLFPTAQTTSNSTTTEGHTSPHGSPPSPLRHPISAKERRTLSSVRSSMACHKERTTGMIPNSRRTIRWCVSGITAPATFFMPGRTTTARWVSLLAARLSPPTSTCQPRSS